MSDEAKPRDVIHAAVGYTRLGCMRSGGLEGHSDLCAALCVMLARERAAAGRTAHQPKKKETP